MYFVLNFVHKWYTIFPIIYVPSAGPFMFFINNYVSFKFLLLPNLASGLPLKSQEHRSAESWSIKHDE